MNGLEDKGNHVRDKKQETKEECEKFFELSYTEV